VFAPSLTLGLTGQRWFADEPAYQLDTLGGRLTLTRDLGGRDVVAGRGARSSVSASLNYAAEEFVIATDVLADLSLRDQLIATGLDPRTGSGRGRLTALSIDFSRSTTANVLDSRRGYVLQGHVERAGGLLGGDYDYNEATLEGRVYLTLARFGVLANRLRVGSIDGRGNDETDVPFYKRYFLGGSNSLRGWGRFQVAPLSGSGLPIGGHSFLEWSSEVRTAPLGKLALVAFFDAGNVWTEAWKINLSDMRYDAGPGIRYDTPIGPLRVDLAYQLKLIPGLLVEGLPQTRRWRLHLSIGQAF
jgi:outer membrane protein assembly factor BamA